LEKGNWGENQVKKAFLEISIEKIAEVDMLIRIQSLISREVTPLRTWNFFCSEEESLRFPFQFCLPPHKVTYFLAGPRKMKICYIFIIFSTFWPLIESDKNNKCLFEKLTKNPFMRVYTC
jgi:hypothetical protein